MHFEAYIDGACARNGYRDAQGGFGVVLFLDNKIVMTASMPLCHCDGKTHTSNLAELKAAHFMMKFVHEYGVLGKPNHQCRGESIGIDGRPMGVDDISLTVQCDSRFVVDGYNGRNQYKAHKDMWNNIMSFKRCVERSMKIDFRHVRGHHGDAWNEAADELAKEATEYEDPHEWCEVECKLCENEYSTPENIARHLKEAHFHDHDIDVLTRKLAKASLPNECELCTKVLGSGRALQQHMLHKHHVRISLDGTTTFEAK